MYKMLLLSDTHGKLDIINELALQTKADFVIHAGDFGFYEEQSVKRLNQRELRLLITHSSIKEKYSVDKQTDRKILMDIINHHKLLGDFPDYISGRKKFSVPVYAVYGNHEDIELLRRLKKNLNIDNLYMLDENHVYEFKNANELEYTLYGLGGNFLVSKKLLDVPIAGNSGKVWLTLHQFGTLYKKVNCKSKPSILVTHVSPGKEPLLTRLMLHFMPNLWISGHMGAPYTCVWNQFTIREMNETITWLQTENSLLDELTKSDLLTEEASLAIEIIKRDIPRKDFWFKKMWNLNLPDAKDGYAILNYDDGRFSLETYSRGMKF
jgi:predicted phosphodiesterase